MGLIDLLSRFVDYLVPLLALALAVYVLRRYLFSNRQDDALIRACRENDLQAVHVALRNRPDLEFSPPPRQNTALIISVLLNNLAIVTALLAAGAKVEARDEEGRTSLILAAQKGWVDIVQALLARGADPTAKSYDGWTALIMACYSGHTEIVHILLARCADVKWRNKQGMNALAIAVGQHHHSQWLDISYQSCLRRPR
jgi:uncharacterized protein